MAPLTERRTDALWQEVFGQSRTETGSVAHRQGANVKTM